VPYLSPGGICQTDEFFKIFFCLFSRLATDNQPNNDGSFMLSCLG
jgi:hypothetical protein